MANLISSMESLEKETLSKAEYRIKKIEVQEEWMLNTVTITYNDDSVWSYGPGWATSCSKTIVFTENEYLVKLKHEGLDNRKWAGVGLELETNKGRVFCFQSRCSSIPKEKWTVITADIGMEILLPTIKLGQVVGFKQQPRLEDSAEVDSKAEWYSILYHALKEDEEEEIEKKQFKDKTEADSWWKEVSQKTRAKQGRGALYLNTKKNTILHKAGSRETITKLEKEAGKLGFYCNMAGEELEVDIASIIPVLWKALPKRQDMLWVVVMFFLMVISDSLCLESMRISGELISFLSGSGVTPNQTLYSKVLCETVLKCGEDSRYDFGMSLLISYVLMILVETLVDAGYELIRSESQVKFEEPLKRAVNEKALNLDQSFHDSHSYYEVKSKCDPNSISDLITYNIPSIVRSCVRLCTVFFYLARMRPVLALVVLFFTIFTDQCVFLPMAKQSMKLWIRKYIFYDMASALEYEAYGLISTIKQCSTENFHLQAYKKAADKIVANTRRVLLQELKNDFIIKIFDNAVMLGAMLYEITRNQSNPGEFTTIYLFIGQFSGTFTRVAGQFKQIRKTLTRVEKYEEFMTTKMKVVSGADPVGDLALTGEIKFEGVHFTYPSRPGEKVLSGLDLTIQPNKMTAIVGESGSGKSTLAKLLMRQYDPDEGKLTLGGKDYRSFDLGSLHSKMAIVSQNSELMDATLSDNIGYDKGSTDPAIMARIVEAARLARCDFIDKFRSGLETFAGSKGLSLSGGQQQRISIARAAIRDPEILILDEATSSLDTVNEAAIQKALTELMANKTTIVIAHRLSTIRDADVILCMKDGKVVESGTHDELTALRGNYHKLTSRQLVEATTKQLEEAVEFDNIAEIMDGISQTLKQSEKADIEIKEEIVEEEEEQESKKESSDKAAKTDSTISAQEEEDITEPKIESSVSEKDQEVITEPKKLPEQILDPKSPLNGF